MTKLLEVIEKIGLKRKILKILENGIPEGSQQIGKGEYVFSKPSKGYVSALGIYPNNTVQITAYEEFKPNHYRQITDTKFVTRDSNPILHRIGIEMFKKISAPSIHDLKENYETTTRRPTSPIDVIGTNLSITMSEEFHKFD